MKKTNNKFYQRVLALVLALMLCVGMMPMAVFAVDGESQVPTHTHKEGGWNCVYTEPVTELVCDKHIHTDECYETKKSENPTCGKEEHTHNALCYKIPTELTCTNEDPDHTHDIVSCYADGDPVLICGKEKHTHNDGNDGCYEFEAVKVCEQEDHTHGDECYNVKEGKWTCTPPAVEEEYVTLTIDANANGEEVKGMPNPASWTKKKGEKFLIPSLRTTTVKREGYTFVGLSRDPDASRNDSDLMGGTKVLFEKDTTLYMAWVKAKEPSTPTTVEMTQVKVLSSYLDSEDKKMQNELTPTWLHYDYSYEYAGVTYSGSTKDELAGGFSPTGNLLLPIPTEAFNSGASLDITLTVQNHVIPKYQHDRQMVWTGSQWIESRTNAVTFSISISAASPIIKIKHYYSPISEEPEKPEVTERQVDIMVSFQKDPMHPLTLGEVDSGYSLTYSYENVDGETVTETLSSASAEQINNPRNILVEDESGLWQITGQDPNILHSYYKWTITVPVVGEGMYLDLTQSNYASVDPSYVWGDVYGVQMKGDTTGSYLGKLYVSKDNNPVTTIIYNVYTRHYTVTYQDGVNGAAFKSQSYDVREGNATPAFDGTPSREGYTFAGWSPAVAATVTGKATYVAQWRINDTDTGTGSDPNPTPTPTPTPDPTPTPTPEPTDDPTDIPDPEPPLTDSPDVTPDPEPSEPPVEIPDDDPPLAEIPDEDPPLAEIPDDTTEIDDEEVPLADVPKTGDDAKIWLTLALLSAAGLGVIGLIQRRTRKNGRDS